MGERAGHELKRRRGFKKAEPGVWWAEWCTPPPPRLFFPSADVDAMSADRAQEALACLF